MSDRFEQLTRATANGMSRRGVLRMIGAAAAGATAATVLKPFRGDAQEAGCEPGLTPCGDGCCPAGLICADRATARCGCDPSIMTFCGDGCCLKRDTCSNFDPLTCCCRGDTPCGVSCCRRGVACIDRSRGLCGCPPRTTPCGSGENLRCCPAGQSCSSEQNCVPAHEETEQGSPGAGPGYVTPCQPGFCPNGPCGDGGCSFPFSCNEGTGCCECETPCGVGQGQCPQFQVCFQGCCVFGGG